MAAQFESRFDAAYDGEIPDSVDEVALRRMETVAHALDECIRIPGTNATIGLDPLLGLLPVAGDLASAGISGYIVLEAANLGVSYPTLVKMIANIGIDAAGGSIPVVGTLFDAVWKVNRRNVEHALTDLDTQRTESSELDHDEAVEVPIQPTESGDES